MAYTGCIRCNGPLRRLLRAGDRGFKSFTATPKHSRYCGHANQRDECIEYHTNRDVDCFDWIFNQ